ncbi:FAD-dependent oxidoreductase [Ruicaihuangia caeni]|uniref:FAD-dependent oxidoreductase n=1 Tax=Ruicaihuangia caeni TaxID=3042517 RepID=A0AAW6TCM4_9MICO|nr:FAD-dependent oxidoreductase [Klugiella sp. YN-L-19]MDI2098792.1 FAD-dependent oxidoreductase [Klugiella sp. YN-L-19]
MADLTVDIVVLGWGKAGKTLAGALGRQGKRVALVERSAEMAGGSCININCVPTKALVHDSGMLMGAIVNANANANAPSEAGDSIRRFASSVARRDTLVEKLRARNRALLDEVDMITLVQGQARFTAPRRIEVSAGHDRLLISAETVVVNTGTVPAMPAVASDAARHGRLHDSTSIQHVDPLPERLVIVGGGYVGLEFAGMFAGFGSGVVLLDRHDGFMRGEDRDVADAVRALLEERGVEVVLGAEVEAVDDTGDRAVVAYGTAGEAAHTRHVEADAVLFATGRRPVTDDLGLDAAGVTTDDRGFIVVDDRLRTSAEGVFAVGDVNGGPQFTYVSLDDYRIVLDQLTGDGSRSTRDRAAVPSTIFLTPPLARVGMNETEARESGRDVLVAVKQVADIAAMPRPKIVGETHGLIKVVVDAATDRILGATLFCVDAQEVINLVALAMRAGVTATELRDGIWTHPSSTEALNEVLGDLRPLTW